MYYIFEAAYMGGKKSIVAQSESEAIDQFRTRYRIEGSIDIIGCIRTAIQPDDYYCKRGQYLPYHFTHIDPQGWFCVTSLIENRMYQIAAPTESYCQVISREEAMRRVDALKSFESSFYTLDGSTLFKIGYGILNDLDSDFDPWDLPGIILMYMEGLK